MHKEINPNFRQQLLSIVHLERKLLQLIEQEEEQGGNSEINAHRQEVTAAQLEMIKAALLSYQGKEKESDPFLYFHVTAEEQNYVLRLSAIREAGIYHYAAEVINPVSV